MTKTARIREVLAAAKGKSLTFDALMEAGEFTGKASVENACLYLQKKGEVKIDRSTDPFVITLTAGKRGRPAKKPGRKPKKAARAPRQTARPTPRADVRTLALANLVASASALRAAVRGEVDGVDDNLLLAGAIDTLDRAEQLLQAVGAA